MTAAGRHIEYPPISDEELLAAAEELFLEYDGAEAGEDVIAQSSSSVGMTFMT